MTGADRLDLHPLDRAGLQAVVDADATGRRWHPEFPLQDDRDAARMTLKHGDPVFGCYTVVERSTGLAVGTIGFFGPPDESGVAMIGYGLVPSARGAGCATEALRALVALAFAQPGVRRLEADPLPDNVASHRVLEKAGFVRTHSTADAHWYALDRTA
ncbi:GNAT family N-acetyltransferase [Dactylosporangium sp. AC04546]|uniref:GNAT family N-acetyltransferase n=1 Tax=Dactylosporangium sp. AC04546 TaxID=2862460 RepID=UPI001EDF8EB5|nr:GNAT family N-acetyltransferase [Dactylosporangium sp. AC04546]WVK88776.1 GNAT family N-acetyltransferase [Dactylosporangium sp. AC04546]